MDRKLDILSHYAKGNTVKLALNLCMHFNNSSKETVFGKHMWYNIVTFKAFIEVFTFRGTTHISILKVHSKVHSSILKNAYSYNM